MEIKWREVGESRMKMSKLRFSTSKNTTTSYIENSSKNFLNYFVGGFCNANRPKHSIISSSNALRIWFQSARNSDGGAGFNASYTTLKDEGG